MDTFECTACISGKTAEAKAAIADDRLSIGAPFGAELLFADIVDMRLLNYTVRLKMYDQTAEISKLGFDTEDFFEKLWLAYAKKSTEALFVAEKAQISVEGDYALNEEETSQKGIAKTALYQDCICMVPHNISARRIPLCFCGVPEREDFAVDVTLDTGESYRFARLGYDTEPFFDALIRNRKATVQKWNEAHARLESNLRERMGEAAEELDVFAAAKAQVVSGLFSAEDEESFWVAAIKDGRAAVELMTDEDSATYLYRFDTDLEDFTLRLRHAMEAVKKNRRLIYIDDEALQAEPLYRMAYDRSAYVRFFRGCSDGRVIHTGGWDKRVMEFFSGM